MPSTILAEISYSGYISLAKFLPFVGCFYLWLLLINWVYFDTKAVQTKTLYWVTLMTSAGCTALLVWMFVPIYIIGLLLFLIIGGTSAILYIMHRNAMVADFEKVLTIQHLKGLFTNEKKNIEKNARGFHFITANGNQVDIPEPKSKESYGFQVACTLLDDAIWRRVAQIKMTPGTDDYNVTYVIDGVLTKRDPLPLESVGYLIYFLKHLADLNVEEKRKPQKGKFKIEKSNKKIGWSVQTAGSTAGEQIIIEKDEEYSQMDLATVGFPSEQITELRKLRDYSKGLFIVAGTKGSGLTTAFYALLKNHDPFLFSIHTIEKRPAGPISSITQNTYDPVQAKGHTYAQKLQTMVRMGLDIVGVGDCDDADTAKLICEVSKNKLVYVSIEAENSVAAIAKWMQLVPDKKLALGNLVGVASTRLIRTLCDECKEEYEPNLDLLKKLSIPAGKIKVMCRPGETQYTRGGKPIICDKCQGMGYYGRTAVLESFVISEKALQELLAAESLKEMAAVLRRNGMKFVPERITEKLAEGVTSVNEMVRVLKPAAPQAPAQKSQEALD